MRHVQSVQHYWYRVCTALLYFVFTTPNFEDQTAIMQNVLQMVKKNYGGCGNAVIKVLRYKSEDRWLDSRWYHWNFSFT